MSEKSGIRRQRLWSVTVVGEIGILSVSRLLKKRGELQGSLPRIYLKGRGLEGEES